jgi:hypothetical protein
MVVQHISRLPSFHKEDIVYYYLTISRAIVVCENRDECGIPSFIGALTAV